MAHVALDEDVQKSLARHLRGMGHTVDRAVEVDLGGMPDEAIFAYAQPRGAVVITRDLGFVNAMELPPDHGGGILLRFPTSISVDAVNQEVMQLVDNQISLDEMRGNWS